MVAKEYIREEGIYVGEKLRISQSRVTTMENRFLKWENEVSVCVTMIAEHNVFVLWS